MGIDHAQARERKRLVAGGDGENLPDVGRILAKDDGPIGCKSAFGVSERVVNRDAGQAICTPRGIGVRLELFATRLARDKKV